MDTPPVKPGGTLRCCSGRSLGCAPLLRLVANPLNSTDGPPTRAGGTTRRHVSGFSSCMFGSIGFPRHSEVQKLRNSEKSGHVCILLGCRVANIPQTFFFWFREGGPDPILPFKSKTGAQLPPLPPSCPLRARRGPSPLSCRYTGRRPYPEEVRVGIGRKA